MADLRFAFRSLFKSPGFTIVAICTIAIGIGANTALFSIFNKLVLNPIDLPRADQLVRIWTNAKERNLQAPVISVPKYRLFRDQQTVFSAIAASTFNSFVLTRDGADPEQLSALNVTASFVPTLGISLAKGRNFTVDEDKGNGPHVCILTDELWKTRFGSRENIIGETIQINGVGTTVVGVLAPGLPTPLAGTLLLEPWPLSVPFITEQQLEGGAGYLQVTARLKPGVAFAQAEAQVRSIATRYRQEFPGHLDANHENELRTWVQEQVGTVRPTFVLLLSAVGLVLLIACANVANLFLGRLSARHKEFAVRLSLGATRRHLMRQLLVESLLFCVMAASLGVLLAAWSLHAVEGTLANQFATTTKFSLDPLTLLFTVAISALSSLAIGLVPALQSTSLNLADVLKDSARGTVGGARGTRFRGLLIVAEVSLSVVLLIGSTLLLISFAKLQSTPAGFSARGVASAFVNPSPQHYPTQAEKADFYNRVLDKLRSYPQVKRAAVVQTLPLAATGARYTYTIFGRTVAPLAERPLAYLDLASEDYFTMLKIPLMHGRLFSPTDIENAPLVCVINESFARRLFPNEEAIGQYVVIGQQADIKMEIVGIVGDVKSIGLNVPPPETIYRPVRQKIVGGQNILASTDGDANTMQALLRSAVASVDNAVYPSS